MLLCVAHLFFPQPGPSPWIPDVVDRGEALQGDKLQGTELSCRGTTETLCSLYEQIHRCNKSAKTTLPVRILCSSKAMIKRENIDMVSCFFLLTVELMVQDLVNYCILSCMFYIFVDVYTYQHQRAHLCLIYAEDKSLQKMSSHVILESFVFLITKTHRSPN